MRRLGEIALISDYLAPLATHPGAFGLKDDAALLTELPATGLTITTDGLVAGVHFFEDDDPGDVAYKALAVNVSDLASKAAKPIAYTLTLALAKAPKEAWACSFADGLKRAQNEFGIALIGGDTVSARGAWWLSVTAFGEASARGLVPRGGAKPGDLLYVSGTLGDAAFGLALRQHPKAFSSLTQAHRDFLSGRYLYPEPRLGLTPALEAEASAAMDVSDGLALDLARMCAASGVSAEVHAAKIPLSDAVQVFLETEAAALKTVLTGGDDYEILAAVPAGQAKTFEAAGLSGGVCVTCIGAIREGSEPVAYIAADGSALMLDVQGFEHFSD